MNLEQYNAVQPRIVEVQRLALLLAELGEMRISRLLMEAGVRASKLKPTITKEVPAGEPAKRGAK